jgi:hypothetical protein
MSTPTGQYGIIFQGTTGVLGTYVDILGQTRDEVALPSLTPTRMPTTVSSAFPHAGLAGRFSLVVDVVVSAADITLKVQGHQEIDPAAAWGDLWVFDNSDPLTTTTERTFSTSGRYILQTANLGAVNESCVLVTPGDDFEGSISINLVALP